MRRIAAAGAAGALIALALIDLGGDTPAVPPSEREPRLEESIKEEGGMQLARRVAEAAAPAPSVPPTPPPEPAPAEEPNGLQARPEGRRLVLRGRSGQMEEPLPPFADGSGRDAIRTALREVSPGMRACYQQGLQLQPDLEGSLVLEFSLEARDGAGRIVEAEIDDEASTMRAVFVQACILDELSRARFPMPRGDGAISVRYPFQFTPP